MNIDKPVIVIGTTHHNTLSIIRCLGHEHIKPSVILCEKEKVNSYIGCSKYVKECKHVESAELAIDFLRSLDYGCRPTIIVCSDEVASIMDLHYTELESKFDFFNAGENGRITRYMDKALQTELAFSCNINVPISSEHTISDHVMPAFDTFPCIVKPLESIHGGKRFRICNDKVELANTCKEYQNGEKILIQQFIPKDYEIVIDGLSVDGQIIIPGFVKKIRDLLGGTTYSETHPISELPIQLVKSIEQMIREIHYEGLFGVECIVHDGLYFFVEMNLRNDATTYSLAIAGENLPYLYCIAKQQRVIPSSAATQIRILHTMVEFRDFDFVIKCKISLIKWLKQFHSCEGRFFFDAEDIAPYYLARKQYFKDKTNKLISLFKHLK